MITKTDFQRGGAGNLVKYIRRDRAQDSGRKVPVRGPTGRKLSDQQVSDFVSKSRDFGFERHIIVSPDPQAGYSPSEVTQHTQQLMQHELTSNPTMDYLYGVHSKDCHPHSHIVATGREAELRMDRQEIQRFRSRARSQFREKERLKERDVDRKQERTEERREQAHEKELDPEARKETNPDRELSPEPDREQEPERDFGIGGAQ
jgi:hypothetical protein